MWEETTHFYIYSGHAKLTISLPSTEIPLVPGVATSCRFHLGELDGLGNVNKLG